MCSALDDFSAGRLLPEGYGSDDIPCRIEV